MIRVIRVEGPAEVTQAALRRAGEILARAARGGAARGPLEPGTRE